LGLNGERTIQNWNRAFLVKKIKLEIINNCAKCYKNTYFTLEALLVPLGVQSDCAFVENWFLAGKTLCCKEKLKMITPKQR
jgi:hypothetical protein